MAELLSAHATGTSHAQYRALFGAIILARCIALVALAAAGAAAVIAVSSLLCVALA